MVHNTLKTIEKRPEQLCWSGNLQDPLNFLFTFPSLFPKKFTSIKYCIFQIEETANKKRISFWESYLLARAKVILCRVDSQIHRGGSVEEQGSLSKYFLNDENTEKCRDREVCACHTQPLWGCDSTSCFSCWSIKAVGRYEQSSQINPITQFQRLKPGRHWTSLWQETGNAPGTAHFCTVYIAHQTTPHSHVPPALCIFIFKQLSKFDTIH